MKLPAQVRADWPNSYKKKNGEKVLERLLICIDLTPDAMVADSFEVLAENLPHGEAGSLLGKVVELHVTQFSSRNSEIRLHAKVFHPPAK